MTHDQDDLDGDFPEPMLTLYIGSVTEPIHLPLPDEPGDWRLFRRGLWCGVKMSAAMIAAAVIVILWWAGCEPRAHGQEQPQPAAQSAGRSAGHRAAFWAAQSVAWGAMVADGIISGTNPHIHETCAMYAGPGGKFLRGRYFAVNAPVSAVMTAGSWWVRRRHAGRLGRGVGRWVSIAPAAWSSQEHIRGALSWR